MPLTLPAPRQAALLLDIDGTLLDFAPTPEQVVVPPDVGPTLLRLRAALGDALALVTGRPLEQADALLGGVAFAVAGEHGAVLRRAPDQAVQRSPLPDMPADWLPAAQALAEAHPGARMEAKRRGFVLHFRQAPAAAAVLRDAVAALIAPAGDRFHLLPAAMAWEVRPTGIDKGTAVRRIMAEAPFAGRLPIYIGDDVTDEDGIRAAQEMGGAGLLVASAFGAPAAVRDWLARSAASMMQGGGWAD